MQKPNLFLLIGKVVSGGSISKRQEYVKRNRLRSMDHANRFIAAM